MSKVKISVGFRDVYLLSNRNINWSDPYILFNKINQAILKNSNLKTDKSHSQISQTNTYFRRSSNTLHDKENTKYDF